MRSSVRSRPGPPANSFRFNLIPPSIACEPDSTVLELCENSLSLGCCAKSLLVLVRLAIKSCQGFAHHVELRLAVSFEHLGVALAQHLCDKVVSYSAGAQPRRERVS